MRWESALMFHQTPTAALNFRDLAPFRPVNPAASRNCHFTPRGTRVSFDHLLTLEQFAELVNTPVNTVRFWRQTGYGPKSARIGRRVMYRRAEVDAWLDAQFESAMEADGAA
jgi:predicted DNA-binding transcriptional regulator AlpA